jgi:heptosyltransferase-2
VNRPLALSPTARILAVKLADIGDVLLCTPALRALRARYPQAQIDLLTPPSSAHVLRGAPEINTVIDFNKFPFDTLRSLTDIRGIGRAGRFLFDLRRRRYDAILLFHHYSLQFGSLKFAALALASGAPIRAGVDNGRGWFLTHRVPDAGFGAMHEASYWLETTALLGADPTSDGRGLTLPLNAADGAFVTEFLSELGVATAHPLIALHPGAGWYSLARRWPPAYFAQLARMLISQFRATILLVGGPDEVELAEQVRWGIGKYHSGEVRVVAGRTSIAQSAALFARCDLFIGNDSGPLHLATAAGVPAIGIFGLSNWRAFGPIPRGPAPAPGVPWGAPVEWLVDDTHPPLQNPKPKIQNPPAALVVRRDLPCQPCLYRGQDLGLREGCGTRECLTALDPAAVFAAASWMLNQGLEVGG